MNSQVVQLMETRYRWQPNSSTTTMEKTPTTPSAASRNPFTLNHCSQVRVGVMPDLEDKNKCSGGHSQNEIATGTKRPWVSLAGAVWEESG
ncbi:hypothetical protein F7725_013224 [Dissostichus mawsoni]|uniref:Uncharacterized protein n=1 Tax=Dissostichus mawsoni TaxID=36200 RepID=A0A7J5YPH3_DISMA|nr:hypothetical protein F7725_013224 [Dissostichus mawsoni]